MSSNTTNNISLFSVAWYESIQFKIAMVFLILFFCTSMTLFMILKSFGDTIIEEAVYLRLQQANNEVVTTLKRQTILSTTIAQAMANLAEKLPNTDKLYTSLMPQIINHKGTDGFIAGGGIWPAPYQFHRNKKNHSFSWTRDRLDKLTLNHTKSVESKHNYHHTEWYVAGTYLSDGEAYWSKSYIDPHSLEPMVSVSVPLIKAQQNVGVSTIELRLEGLHKLLKKATHSFGGYAFVVDRNGIFLSYPDIKIVMNNNRYTNKPAVESYISYQALAKKSPLFNPFAQILNAQNKQIQTKNALKMASQEEQLLSEQLILNSDQITKKEAPLIARSILHLKRPHSSTLFTGDQMIIEDDPLLNEAVFYAITEMPETDWKIITVMPYSHGVEKISTTYKNLIISTLIAFLLTIFIIWLFIRNIVTVPIIHLAKQILSQVENNDNLIEHFHTNAKGELGSLVDVLNLRTRQLLHSQKKIEKLALFDPLTGLPNRLMLLNRLTEQLASSDKHQGDGALLFIDLDNFKNINDSLGHNMGDELLVILAARFIECINKEDTVARLGGDEFVVLIINNKTDHKALTLQSTSIAQKLVDAMQEPILLQGNPHYMTISIGISIFSNQEAQTVELLRQADTAMYYAKGQGKNGFCFFNKQMQENAYRRLEIERTLRIALKNKELFLVYQPQVDAQGHCLGVESLVRWTHPQKGVLSPLEFIEIAEECGLILELGTWVLEESCAQLRAWADEGIHLDKISVNVSPKQFRDIHFVDNVRNALDKYQLNPNQLTLEITEGIVIDDIKDTIYKMDVLKSLGVRLSIDDFGTGYSSLRYLKELPLHQLKIDQSFVRDIIQQPKDAMIVKTIIAMANNLNLNVIAEGVEDKQQQIMLMQKGCLQFQGYYFSKPKTATEISLYIIEQRAQRA